MREVKLKRISGGVLVAGAYVPLGHLLCTLRPVFVLLVIFSTNTPTRSTRSPMTSLDKLAKMDGWDVGGDAGTSNYK